MYNYDFKDEKVKFEKLNCFIEVDNKEYMFNLLITNKNILLFNNINKKNVLNGRGAYLPAENELFLKIPIKNLKYKIEDGNTLLIYKNKNIVIYEFDACNYIN